MKKEQDSQMDGAGLRRRAEARLSEKGKGQPGAAGDRMTATEMQRLMQELQIHQIELEMQNEELKRARDEAEAERERYLDLYDFAPVGYVTLDVNGVIHQVNLAGARQLGGERSKLLNRRFGHFVSAADGPVFTAFLKKVFENQGKASCAVSLGQEGKQRSYVYMEATVIGEGQECRAAVLDWTVRRKTQDEVLRLHEELEERSAEHIAQLEAANKELDSFSYSISHDLRAPLRAIDGYARMILRKQQERFDQDTVDRLNEIRESAKAMGQLIDDLLAFSRLGRQEPRMAKLDMDDLFHAVWDELRLADPDRRLTLETGRLPQGMGDPNLIRQVWRNLLSNAIKFTRLRDTALIEVGGYPEGEKCVYFVRDNGAGFNMAYYDKLFGIFQRLHGPDEYEGTGVGLAITQRIILRHGGRIWAEGEVDKGTKFSFTLPAPKG